MIGLHVCMHSNTLMHKHIWGTQDGDRRLMNEKNSGVHRVTQKEFWRGLRHAPDPKSSVENIVRIRKKFGFQKKLDRVVENKDSEKILVIFN